MLRFLASISPVALLLIGAVPAATAGWLAHGVKFDWFDRPAIIREATATADAACAIRTMDAANRAERAERVRQSRANAEALRIYEEALDASQRAAWAAETQFELEIESYEHQLAAEGRSCQLTGADIDWLHERGTPGAD
jgi:hypothetical protein